MVSACEVKLWTVGYLKSLSEKKILTSKKAWAFYSPCCVFGKHDVFYSIGRSRRPFRYAFIAVIRGR